MARDVPVEGNIKDDWARVRPTLEELCSLYEQTWIPEDVYAACVHDPNTTYFTTPDGYVVAQYADGNLFLWVAYAFNRGHNLVGKHLPFFEQLARMVGASKIVTASPIDELEGYLRSCGFDVQTRYFERPV